MAAQSLHVVVDGRELAGQATGVGRYLINILRSWASDAGHRHRVSVILAAAATPEMRALAGPFNWVHEPARSYGTRWEQTRLARLVAELEADVFFAAGYTAPWRLRCPYVLAVYDVSFFAHPKWFPAREGLRRRIITRAAARRAHSVVTISEFSAREIERYLDVPRRQIHIAPPGVFKGVSHRSTPGPLVLYSGSLFARRHIPELIEGFARTAAVVPSSRLVLVGDNRTRPPIDPAAIAGRYGIADRVEWRRYVSDEELHRLYASAGVFAFLSEYEGFGMTPMEALAHGVPLVLLDTEVAREVYADAARYVGLDAASIGGALAELLTDAAARETILAAGRRRRAAYSWARSADVIRRALEAAAGRS